MHHVALLGSVGAPTGHPAIYDVLVALHVTFAVIGFASVALSGAYGAIARGGNVDELSRYLSGRTSASLGVIVAPVFGIAAMAVRPGGSEYSQLWAIAGMVIWLVAGTLLLAVVRPTETRLRSKTTPADELRVHATRLAWAAAASDLLFLGALLMMVTQPR